MPSLFQKTHKKIRQSVHQGRLKFVGVGWTQNNEAVTHYSAILDNLSLGMKFIADNFGNYSAVFLQHQKRIVNYYVKNFVEVSQ